MLKQIFCSALCAVLLMPGNALSEEDGWWSNVRCRLMFPCDVNIAKCSTGQTQSKDFSADNTDWGSDKMTSAIKCLPLYEVLRGTVRETQSLINNILEKNKTLGLRRNKWRNLAEKRKCHLQVYVRRKERCLDKEQGKLLDDMLQIVSFSHYVDLTARSSLVGMKTTRPELRKLGLKMMATVCQMRPAFQATPVKYVRRNDVPFHLRRREGDPATRHVDTYVILQLIKEFFNKIDEDYESSGLNICYPEA